MSTEDSTEDRLEDLVLVIRWARSFILDDTDNKDALEFAAFLARVADAKGDPGSCLPVAVES